MLFLSDKQEIRFRKFTRQSDPNKKGTKAECKLNSPDRKYSKVFYISSNRRGVLRSGGGGGVTSQ